MEVVELYIYSDLFHEAPMEDWAMKIKASSHAFYNPMKSLGTVDLNISAG